MVRKAGFLIIIKKLQRADTARPLLQKPDEYLFPYKNNILHLYLYCSQILKGIIMKSSFKTIICLFILALIFNYSNLSAQEEKHEGKYEVKPTELSDGTLYGTDIDKTLTPTVMKDIFAAPENFEKQNLVVEASIVSVCQEMGCWTVITDGTNEMRAMTLHKFFMPKDLKENSKVVVQGEFQLKEITEQQAKAYEEESGKKSGKEIKGPQKMYMMKITGIKILNN
jgi:hypothetical protein